MLIKPLEYRLAEFVLEEAEVIIPISTLYRATASIVAFNRWPYMWRTPLLMSLLLVVAVLKIRIFLRGYRREGRGGRWGKSTNK